MATMSYNLCNAVLQIVITMSYSLQQQCLTVYGNGMLPLMEMEF